MSTQVRRGNGEGSAPRQRKDGRWQSNIRIIDPLTGEPRRISVTRSTALEVRNEIREIRRRIEDGHAARDSRQTLAMFVENTWIPSALASRDLSPRTKESYKRTAINHVANSAIGRMPLDKIRVSNVRGWIVEMREVCELQPATIRLHYTVLRAVLDDAVTDKLLSDNPAHKVARPRVPRKEAAHLSYEQAQQIIDAMGDSRHVPVIELLLNTGMRRGEALALKWSDIDFDERTLKISKSLSRVGSELVINPPKTEAGMRTLHMNDDVIATLKSVRSQQRRERLRAGSNWAGTDFVFTNLVGVPRDPSSVLRAMQAGARAVGITDKRIGLHTLRHTAATWMLRNGVHLKVVQVVLGHANIAITGDLYSHVDADVKIDALDGLSGRITRKSDDDDSASGLALVR